MNKTPWINVILWMSLPTAINISFLIDKNGTKAFALLLLIIIIFYNAILSPGLSIKKSNRLFKDNVRYHCDSTPLIVVALFTLILIPCIVRGLGSIYSFSNVIANVGLFTLAPIAFTLSMIQEENQERRTKLLSAVFLGLPLYVLANVLAYLAGFAATPNDATDLSDERINQTLGLIGVSISRVAFPLTTGTNEFGAIAALSALICIFYGAYSKGALRFFSLILLPITVTALILTDARGAVLATVSTGAIAFWMSANSNRIKLNYLLLPFIPIFPSLAYRFFEAANNGGGFSFLVRSGVQGARLGIGTGRGDLWKSVLTYFSDFSPIHIVGYGAFGHATSNISSNYAWIFNAIGATLMSCHNSFLQYLIDTGYIGAIGWILLLAAFTHQATKLSENSDAPLSAKYVITSLLILTIVQSQTEVFGTIYTPEILIIILVAIVSTGFFSGHSKAPITGREAHRAART